MKQIQTKTSHAINVKHNKHFATGLLDYGIRFYQTAGSATTSGNKTATRHTIARNRHLLLDLSDLPEMRIVKNQNDKCFSFLPQSCLQATDVFQKLIRDA